MYFAKFIDFAYEIVAMLGGFSQRVFDFLSKEVDISNLSNDIFIIGIVENWLGWELGSYSVLELMFGVGITAFLALTVVKWVIGIIM